MPEGIIVGGWNFVIAAYCITGVVLVLYSWSLHRRTQQHKKHGGRS